MKSAMLFIGVAVIAFALQTPQPIPPFEGDGNPQHDGQPTWCQSSDDAHTHNCDCKAMSCQPEGGSGGGENPKCKVYCRPKACRCRRPCETARVNLSGVRSVRLAHKP